LLRLRLSPLPSIRPKEKHNQQIAEQFTRRVRNAVLANQMMAFVTENTLEECYFKILQDNLEKDLPNYEAQLRQTLNRPHVGWHDLYKQYPNLINNYMPTLNNFRTRVFAIPMTLIEASDLTVNQAVRQQTPSLESRMLNYIQSVPILPQDAYLLAIAERIKSPVVTFDKDFHNVNSVQIYGTS
jgi:hypothetical protein